ncbi:MAG: hypothetical protein BWK76_28320 [Desulfobulbaceae bacterium A2]|nr:MAG: hypothetical protein BWK76_28320 [Desulfobulbaceae bacterium A2]
MRKMQIVVLSIAVIAVIAVCTAHAGDAKSSDKSITVDSVQKAIVGAWNGVWDEPNMRMSYLLSFDAQGRITEAGTAAGGFILGSEDERKGKVKYRLEQRKDGPGVNLIRVGTDGKESREYIVEAVEEDKLTMRSINQQTKAPMQPVVWKRVSKEPYKVDGEKPDGKKSK